jgi:diamine N-acetyltransferase
MPESNPTNPKAMIHLREINEDNLREVCDLSRTLSDAQRHMVADNSLSIAQGCYSKHAWFRAIYAGETPVGFLMLYDDPETPEYFLWRLMIAGPYQRMGYGRRAVEMLIEHVKARPGARELLVSCGEGEASPEGFYLQLGFRRDGKMYDDEVGLSLPLS